VQDNHHHRKPNTGAAVAAGVALGTGHAGEALLICARARRRNDCHGHH